MEGRGTHPLSHPICLALATKTDKWSEQHFFELFIKFNLIMYILYIIFMCKYLIYTKN